MSMADDIKKLSMTVDKNFYDSKLIEALNMYHSLIRENIIEPRENQLNTSGVMPKIVHFNSYS